MSERQREQPGAIPIWALNGRPSASGDAARLDEIARLRSLSRLERVCEALTLGQAEWLNDTHALTRTTR